MSTQFLRAAAECRFQILTYCFMPDHVHLLVEGEEAGSDGKAFIARSKQYSAYGFGARTGTKLWQRDSFEQLLRDREEALAVARYILANPVRARLVERPSDYPFIGSFAWDRQEMLGEIGFEGSKFDVRRFERTSNAEPSNFRTI